MINAALFSSNKDKWETPQDLFLEYHRIFNFTIDLAATRHNAKLPRFFTKRHNALVQDWSNERGWLNPPYGRGVAKWVRKSYESALQGALIVSLLAARTDTKWFHTYIKDKALVRFLEGRLYFELYGEPSPHPAPFPSMIVIWK